MPDRVIRDELLESEKWLSLKDNCDRLAFVALLLKADSLGDFSAERFRLLRLWRDFGITTVALVAKTLAELVDHDLIRLYEVNEKPLLHIPRFGQRMRYLSRVFPVSPWITEEQKQRLTNNSPDSHLSVTRLSPAEEKRSEKKKFIPKVQKPDLGLELRREVWQAYSSTYRRRYRADPTDNAPARSAIKRFCSMVPSSDASGIAEFFVLHNNGFYVSKGHNPNLLAADAAKLRTEWLTNTQITQTSAQQVDKRQTNRGVFEKLIEESKNEKSKP